MNTLTKLALGLMGQLKPLQPAVDAAATLTLPAPRRSGGMPLMQALLLRESQREFAPKALRKQMLSDLLWAAGGINRPELGGRTAPSAMNAPPRTASAVMSGTLMRALRAPTCAALAAISGGSRASNRGPVSRCTTLRLTTSAADGSQSSGRVTFASAARSAERATNALSSLTIFTVAQLSAMSPSVSPVGTRRAASTGMNLPHALR
jgi:hypothetical protein